MEKHQAKVNVLEVEFFFVCIMLVILRCILVFNNFIFSNTPTISRLAFESFLSNPCSPILIFHRGWDQNFFVFCSIFALATLISG